MKTAASATVTATIESTDAVETTATGDHHAQLSLRMGARFDTEVTAQQLTIAFPDCSTCLNRGGNGQ